MLLLVQLQLERVYFLNHVVDSVLHLQVFVQVGALQALYFLLEEQLIFPFFFLNLLLNFFGLEHALLPLFVQLLLYLLLHPYLLLGPKGSS